MIQDSTEAKVVGVYRKRQNDLQNISEILDTLSLNDSVTSEYRIPWTGFTKVTRGAGQTPPVMLPNADKAVCTLGTAKH